MTEIFYAKNKKEWRAWLRKNHKKEKRVFLLKYKKHTGQPALSHQESMDEAICFGWIDTIVKRIDDETYVRGFAKRTDKSRWSNATQSYARRLIEEGKMTKAGLKMYELGLKKPVLDRGLSKNPDTPPILKKALAKNPKAKKNFENFAPSYRRYYIYWVENAKLPETKKRRIAEIVKKAEANQKQ